MRGPGNPPALPLSDIRIVEFTWATAGPFISTLAAMMGAQVIKVESYARLDRSRLSTSAGRRSQGDVEGSPHFAEVNVNKLSVQINLKEPDGTALARKLVGVSNVVVENQRGGALDRLGLGYDDLRKARPDLIMVSVSTGGGIGPDRGAPGYAPIFNAMSGAGYITGYEDGPPTELRVSVDMRVAFSSAYALLAAVYHWRKTGQGQHIDVSATEAIACLVGHTHLAYAMNGRSPSRRGNEDAFMAPHDCYRCQGDDAWVSIAVATDAEWQALCRVIGAPELATDERFRDGPGRWRNQQALRPRLESWTGQRTPYEAMLVLQAAGVAATPAFTLADLMHDPHIRERGAIVDFEHERMGRLVAPGAPWKLSKFPSLAYRAGPLMGKHNQDVFGDLLGFSDAEIAELVARRVIY